VRQLSLVCDPFAGGCEPAALDKLVAARADVRCLAHMHAKVYCSDAQAVLGSANLSKRALEYGAIEAVATLTAPEDVRAVRAWFD
jgi:phosphatidylserine/phosphatidylglycerophosphate/cardiolipin synthase-like enzyme